jgi:hypothetical protein
MSDPATNLDRLHDLVLPPSVPWWPPAPGWYVVFGLALAAAALLAWRAWKRWQADAYRRAALRELTVAADAPAIAELLRRTALAFAPRPVVAAKTGTAWADWVAAQSDETMTVQVRELLAVGIYAGPAADRDVRALSDYAARWIATHRLQAHRTGQGR